MKKLFAALLLAVTVTACTTDPVQELPTTTTTTLEELVNCPSGSVAAHYDAHGNFECQKPTYISVPLSGR